MQKNSLFRFVALAALLILPMLYFANRQTIPVARGKSAAIPLTDQLTPEQLAAQNAALADSRVQAYTAGKRTEVFGVHNIYAKQFTAASADCANANCRQVEIYDYDSNAEITAIVNVDNGKVLDVLRLVGAHPGINKRLKDRAIELAVNAPEVIKILGYKPEFSDEAPMEANLINTQCNEGHLCAAPTFRIPNGVLWAIIDLTEDKFVRIEWTTLPDDTVAQHEPYAPEDCPTVGTITNRNGWTMGYGVTGTDGFSVYDVYYNGTLVIHRAKNVEWHADYGSSGYVDSTGCSPSGGFPIYPFGDAQIVDIMSNNQVVGFEVVQDFRMSNWGQGCNYRYEQHYQFYTDGRFRPVTAAYGKGCGTNSLYRPVSRIDLDLADSGNDNFYRWNGTAWTAATTEDYYTPTNENGHGPHQISPEGYSWMIGDPVAHKGYYVVQDVGQFPNGKGDTPFVYATLYHANEGETDLGAVGTCCNDNYQQGPHQYVNGENIQNANIVLWYVPQSLTDAVAPGYYCWTVTTSETYPCFSGPMYVPMQAPAASFTFPPSLKNTPVQFTNTSAGSGSGTTYLWNFDDGTTSTAMNPIHTFAQARVYLVTLTVTNAIGTHTATIKVPINGLGTVPTPGPTPTNVPNTPNK